MKAQQPKKKRVTNTRAAGQAAPTSRTSRRKTFAAATHVCVAVRLRALGSAAVAHDLAAKPEARGQP
jgi:hypothetical protein